MQRTVKQTLIIGAACSGKSAFAEQLCLQVGKRRTYVATMEPLGAEACQRVERHRVLRAGKGFVTVECSRNLAEQPWKPTDVMLLECLGTLVANELFSHEKPAEVASEVLAAEIVQGVETLGRYAQEVVVVSNDVAADGVCYSPETMRYIEVLSQVNTLIAQRANRVAEVVCGLPLWIKAGGSQ